MLGVMDNLGQDEIRKNGQETASVTVVCHAAAVVTLPGQVGDGVILDIIVVIDEHLRGDKSHKVILNVCANSPDTRLWLSGIEHQTQVLVVKSSGLGSNPDHDTCILEQEALP